MIASVINTGQEERNEELENENEHLKIRILELEEVQQRVRNGLTGKYSGKNQNLQEGLNDHNGLTELYSNKWVSEERAISLCQVPSNKADEV